MGGSLSSQRFCKKWLTNRLAFISKTPQMANLKDIDYAFFCCDGVYNMDTSEASECAELVGATHSIPYHMIPADPQNNFDQTVAESFEAQGRIILKPGDVLKLEKWTMGT